MRRTLILTALMMVALLCVQAQTLEQILEKNFEATGIEKLADVKTYSMKAKMSLMGMEMPMSIQTKNPDKFRIEMDAMGQKTITAFDGENGWMINPMMGSGVQNLEGEQLIAAAEQTDLEGELYNYQKKGSTAELVGKVNLDGKAAYKIKLTDKAGKVKDYFIDAETNLVAKMKTKVEAMGQVAEVETKMIEYEEINGIMMAKKIEVIMPMGTQTITIDEIKLNDEIDDAIFARPAN